MRNVPMRFCGYTLHHNPAKLKIESSGNIRELASPCCEPQSEHLGSRLRRVSGEGELYGTDCIAQFKRLQGLFESEQPGLLSLPHLPAMTAYLKELSLLAEPKENVLGYRFVFIEAHPPAHEDSAAEVYEALVDGETLWDVSWRYHIPIETLVRLNPQIPHIDDLTQGERVRLC